MLVEADPATLGPADVAREIAAVVRDHASAGSAYDLVLLGNDAADTGDFQVPIRLADELGRPVVNGREDHRASRTAPPASSPTGRTAPRPTTCRCPPSSRVMEGGVEPRYPTITGRMKAKKIEIETLAPPRRQRPAAAGCG